VRNVPQRGRAIAARVARPFGADGFLRHRRNRQRLVQQGADQGFVFRLDPGGGQFLGVGRQPARPRLLQEQRADRQGLRRLSPGDAGLVLGCGVVLRLGGDGGLWDGLTVHGDIGEKGDVHGFYSAGVLADGPVLPCRAS